MAESDPVEIGPGQTGPPSMTSYTSANEAVKPVAMACCDHCSVFCYTRASFSVSLSLPLLCVCVCLSTTSSYELASVAWLSLSLSLSLADSLCFCLCVFWIFLEREREREFGTFLCLFFWFEKGRECTCCENENEVMVLGRKVFFF